MPQAAFAFASEAASPGHTPGLGLTATIYADRPLVRSELHDDAAAAGLRAAGGGQIADLIEGPARPLGDIVLVDCPVLDAAALAALARLDMRAANSGAQLIVSTSVTALDEVFACMDQSSPQILVDTTGAERVIALGEAVARTSQSRVRELCEEDRLVVLRLTEQVGRIAQRLDRLVPAFPLLPESRPDAALAGTMPGYRDDAPAGGELPDPRLVRRIIRQRQLRARFFDAELFADPAWDILLDLTAAMAEKVRVSVTSLCIAASVPPTTALRWIRQMTEAGLLRRIDDETDRRRAFIVLTERSSSAMAAYFSSIGQGEVVPV